MKKKLLATLLCTAMMITAAGCGLQKPETPANDSASTTNTAAADTAADTTTDTAADTAADTSADTAVTPAEDAVTLVYAEVNPLDTIVGQTATKFKETVEEMSNGSIIIDVQASGVLGSENDVLDTMLGGGGTIQMSRISAFALTSYGGEKSMLLSLPYTFVSREHFWNFATSDLASEFLLEPHENGSGVRDRKSVV